MTKGHTQQHRIEQDCPVDGINQISQTVHYNRDLFPGQGDRTTMERERNLFIYTEAG
jgi:hypothetical protein